MLGKAHAPRTGQTAAVDIPFTQALMRNKLARVVLALDSKFEPSIASELELKGLGSETPSKAKLTVDTNLGRT